jgi:purine-cytosine permease-like protein
MNLNIKLNLIVLNIVLGSIMSLAAIFGIKSLKVLASLSVPILIGVLVYAAISAPFPSFTSSASLKMSSITTIIGANIVAVIDMPTYFQYAKSKKDSLIASLVLFGLVLPILEGIGLYLGASVPKGTLLTALIANGSAIVGIFVGFFVIFAGWTTNNMNLYSGAINSRGVFPNFSYKIRVLLIGFIATIASCFSLVDNLSIILAILGVSLSAIGAVCLASYLMNFFLKSELVKNKQTLNLIILLLSIIFGISTSFGLFTLTFLDVLDSFLIAFILTIGARFIPYKSIKKGRQNETTIS